MQAITYSDFGGPEVLTLAEVDVPEPGPGQVRVAVRVAAVNALDSKLRRGYMAPDMPAALPAVPGYDLAGVIDALGPDVTGFSVGDEVLGSSVTGAYAQFALAAADALVAKPETVPWEVAGGFSSAALTAERVLSELGVETGMTLLVHGASGAVGQLVVQLARLNGVQVVGSAGAANQDKIRALGAIPILYGEGFADRAAAAVSGRIDRAADIAGHGDLPALVDLVGDAGHVLTIADPSAAEHGVRFSSGMGTSSSGLGALTSKLARAEITLAVEDTYPLAEAAAAQERSEAGHASGRLVLIIP